MSDILFHYAPNETAFHILSNRTIRLSALSSANDSAEGRILGPFVESALRETSLSEDVQSVVSVVSRSFTDSTEGFAFCMSEDGDLLSQWRSYADDGRGIAIGFDKTHLAKDYGHVNFGKKFFELGKVHYSTDSIEQVVKKLAKVIEEKFHTHGEFIALKSGKSVENALAELSTRSSDPVKVFDAKTEAAPDLINWLLDELGEIHSQIYYYKPRTFHEEAEWRLFRPRHKLPHPEIGYHGNSDRISPYIECLVADPAASTIDCVILGPKNSTNLDWMKAFLESVGLSSVEVRRSDCTTYR